MCPGAAHPPITCNSIPPSSQVDFYVALGCRAFIGNSVATPTALLIMERWRGNRFATYYNGGNVPLELFLPLFP